MTPSADHVIDYRECNLKLLITDGTTCSIEGYGEINFVFRSGNGLVDVLQTNVTHVSDLRNHFFSLPTVIKNGHEFEGRPAETIVRLKSERSISFPLSGALFSLCGYRVDSGRREKAYAVLALGQPPNRSVIHINDRHCAAGHSHEVPLRKTAEQQAIFLEGELRESKRCSMATDLRKGIKQSTYTLPLCDNFSRYTLVYFMGHKWDATELFE